MEFNIGKKKIQKLDFLFENSAANIVESISTGNTIENSDVFSINNIYNDIPHKILLNNMSIPLDRFDENYNFLLNIKNSCKMIYGIKNNNNFSIKIKYENYIKHIDVLTNRTHNSFTIHNDYITVMPGQIGFVFGGYPLPIISGSDIYGSGFHANIQLFDNENVTTDINISIIYLHYSETYVVTNTYFFINISDSSLSEITELPNGFYILTFWETFLLDSLEQVKNMLADWRYVNRQKFNGFYEFQPTHNIKFLLNNYNKPILK